jgi:tetratricopeptide (TPR) repeat protein
MHTVHSGSVEASSAFPNAFDARDTVAFSCYQRWTEMSSVTPTPKIDRGQYRVLGAFVCAAIGIGIWWATRPANDLPLPPDVTESDLEPEVVTRIDAARQRVLDEPESAECWGLLGKVLLANSISPQAETCFRRAEQLDPADPHWPYYLAIVNYYSNVEEAIACLRRAIEKADHSDPSATSPRLQLATFLLEQGRYDEVDGLLRDVRQRESGNPQALYLAALLLSNRNDTQGSIALLRQLTDHPAGRRKASEKLAQLYLRMGDEKTANHWGRIVRRLPEDTLWPDRYGAELHHHMVKREFRFQAAIRLANENRHADAIALLKEMIDKNVPEVQAAYVELGNNLVHLGRGVEAENAYEAALQRSPNDATTHYRLAYVRLLQGEVCENRLRDLPAARAHYRRALASAEDSVRLDPALVEAILLSGQLFLKLDERKAAIAALQKCLVVEPQLPAAHLLLGEALEAEGRLAEAREHLMNAVEFSDVEGNARTREALDRFRKNHDNNSPREPRKP